MREVRWERMFVDELEAAFAACPAVYFPQGLCEPHGPQCAVGLDGLKAHALSCRAATAHGGIVAPTDYWHIHEIGGYAAWSEREVGRPPRTWLSCLPPWQHFKNVCYQIRQADVHGFKAAIFVTGHYGPNWRDLKTLIELIQPHVGTRLYGLPDFEANEPGFDGDGAKGDHAGKVETSLLMALEPECVDMTRVPPPEGPNDVDYTSGRYFAMGRSVRAASRKVGERMVADEVRWIGAKLHELLDTYDRLQPKHALRTFEQVEQMWHDLIHPKLADFQTMQPLWSNQSPPPEDSPWRANFPIPGNWR